MDSSAELKAVVKFGADRLAIVHEAVDPASILVIHQRKCKAFKTRLCSCRPSFVQPLARV